MGYAKADHRSDKLREPDSDRKGEGVQKFEQFVDVICEWSLMAEDVDVQLVGDVQDELHQLVVALEDLKLGLPRAWNMDY